MRPRTQTPTLGRAVMAAVCTLMLAGAAAPAMADDHDRQHHDNRGWNSRERHEHDSRDRAWRDHGRVYYGDRVYVDPPPAVVYGPPPPPPGLNLMFSFGR
jgi:hypothetical protein